MITLRRRLHAVLLLFVLLLCLPQASSAVVSDAPRATVQPSASTAVPAAATADRVSGSDRYATSAAIARRAFPAPFPAGKGVVYLARGDLFADALAGGALTDGPVMLVRRCGDVPGPVAAEIKRLAPARVIALGGAGAVCDDVLRRAAAGRPTGRLAGTTRYETAVQISRRAFPRSGVTEVYLARGAGSAGQESPDAVVGGTLTAGPVLTLPAAGVPDVVREEIARLAPRRVVALGGSGAVSDGQLKQAAGSRSTDRLSGANRYATSAVIAAYAFPHRPAEAYLARGDVFADAVAGGALTGGPIVLVDGTKCASLPVSVRDYLRAAYPPRVVALGGSGGVCNETLHAATQAVDLLWIDTPSLPAAQENRPYTTRLTARGGFGAPYRWNLDGLPTGLEYYLDGSELVITGIPLTAGSSPLSVVVTDRLSEGVGTTLTLEVAATAPGTGWTATGVSMRHNFGCATTDGGGVVCWGANDRGQLGLGSTLPWSRSTPAQVTGLPGPATAVSAGSGHACALLHDGSVWCWGANYTGQLGDGSTTDRSTPAPVRGLPTGVRSVVAGSGSTCALTIGGQAWCWGANDYGQLGDGTTTHRLAPVPLTGIAEPVEQVSFGGSFTCAVTDSGAPWCWGGNWDGQTGHGADAEQVVAVPRQLTAVGPVRALSAGSRHACALADDGLVSCWGDDWNGQMGTGARGHDVLTPQAVPLPAPLLSIEAGTTHTCGLTVDGRAVCWGENPAGAILPGGDDPAAPGVVPGLPAPLSSLTAGSATTCGSSTAGVPWCWGATTGSGGGDRQTFPAPVAGFVRD